METLAFEHHEGLHADARLRGDARGRDGDVREELTAGVSISAFGITPGVDQSAGLTPVTDLGR
jgi:hypothetical protein